MVMFEDEDEGEGRGGDDEEEFVKFIVLSFDCLLSSSSDGNEE